MEKSCRFVLSVQHNNNQVEDAINICKVVCSDNQNENPYFSRNDKKIELQS